MSGGSAKMMSASPAGGSFYVYSIDGRVLAEYNLYGVCVRDYIYMGAQLVAEYQPLGSHYYYYLSDQINSTRVVTDDTGTMVYSAAHDPYGGIQKTWASSFDPALKFSGKERDGESGLDYFGARYYDKSQYRFISPDLDEGWVGSSRNPQAWNYYSFWAYIEFSDISKACRILLAEQIPWSYRFTKPREKPTAHTYSAKEPYPTPNLADQSGDPKKPGFAYQVKLDDLYRSKNKEFKGDKQLLWLYMAIHGMIMAPNDVVFMTGRENYKGRTPLWSSSFTLRAIFQRSPTISNQMTNGASAPRLRCK